MRSGRMLAVGVATFALSLTAISVAAHSGGQRGMQGGMSHGMIGANTGQSAGPGGCEAMSQDAAGPMASAQGGQHGHHAHGTAQDQHGHGAGHDHQGEGMRRGMGSMRGLGPAAPAR